MTRTLTPLGILILIALIVIMVLMCVLIAGSIRYGGPEGLALRIRAELAAHKPHPQFVPTPLPTPTGRLDNSLVLATRPLEGITGATPDRGPIVAPSIPVPATATPHVRPIATVIAATPTQRPPTVTALPAPVHSPAEPSCQISGFSHMWQKWNNCGPATLAMDLSYFGSTLGQDQLAAALKGNQDDKNVSPEEMTDYARSQGFKALVRVNGDFNLLRTLLSNGIPVMVETWLEDEPGNGMGHYRLLTGYDDASQQWTIFDSYVSKGVKSADSYEGILLPYQEMADLWMVFNRTYIVIYTNELEPAVLSILGQDADDDTMWHRALQQARTEVERDPSNAFAWFNLGSDLVALEQFEAAAEAYGKARVIGLPWRMLWYQFGPFEAYYQTGQYEELISLTNATIATAGNIEETYYWKGLGLAAMGNASAARQAWERAIELNASYSDAAAALAGLEQPNRESRHLELTGRAGEETDRGI